jgi:hypothetical protein
MKDFDIEFYKIFFDNNNNEICKYYDDLDEDEESLFSDFYNNCYDTTNLRNKESWWKGSHNSEELKTQASQFYKEHNIWHIHLNGKFIDSLVLTKMNNYIYKGQVGSYIIVYKKIEKEDIDILRVIYFMKHPHGGIEWSEIMANLKK